MSLLLENFPEAKRGKPGDTCPQGRPGRPLDASQKAFYVVKYILPQEEREAQKRLGHGLTAPGKTLWDTCPTPIPTSHAFDLAAQRFGISGRTIRRVKEAMENAKAVGVEI